MTVTSKQTDSLYSEWFWWEERELANHFRDQSDAQLTYRLEQLLKNPPKDTGMPVGTPREWHCLHKADKCDLCEQWTRWSNETSAIMREQRRRKAARR